MKKKENNQLISFDNYIERKYGKRGRKARKNWEAGFKAFKIGILLEEARLVVDH